jgi:hypothetical protein
MILYYIACETVKMIFGIQSLGVQIRCSVLFDVQYLSALGHSAFGHSMLGPYSALGPIRRSVIRRPVLRRSVIRRPVFRRSVGESPARAPPDWLRLPSVEKQLFSTPIKRGLSAFYFIYTQKM